LAIPRFLMLSLNRSGGSAVHPSGASEWLALSAMVASGHSGIANGLFSPGSPAWKAEERCKQMACLTLAVTESHRD
jgi:hypothetical protein